MDSRRFFSARKLRHRIFFARGKERERGPGSRVCETGERLASQETRRRRMSCDRGLRSAGHPSTFDATHRAKRVSRLRFAFLFFSFFFSITILFSQDPIDHAGKITRSTTTQRTPASASRRYFSHRRHLRLVNFFSLSLSLAFKMSFSRNSFLHADLNFLSANFATLERRLHGRLKTNEKRNARESENKR